MMEPSSRKTELDQDDQEQEQRGVRCPDCGCGHAPVYYTRQATGGVTRRSRECRHCGRRFITSEQRVGG